MCMHVSGATDSQDDYGGPMFAYPGPDLPVFAASVRSSSQGDSGGHRPSTGWHAAPLVWTSGMLVPGVGPTNCCSVVGGSPQPSESLLQTPNGTTGTRTGGFWVREKALEVVI